VLQLLNVDGDDDAIFRSQTDLRPSKCDDDSIFQSQVDLQPPKSDSYFNLYNEEQDVPLGGSAHSLRNLLASSSSTGGGFESPKPLAERLLAPDAMYSPIGHASANPSIQRLSDTHANSDDGMRYSQKPADERQTHISDAAILPSDAKYPTAQALAPDDFGASFLHGGGRRPGRTSPTKTKEPALLRTAPLASESDVLAIGDVNIGGSVRRPMSFVKALELSDRLAANEEVQRKRYGAGQLHDVPVPEVDEEGDDSDMVEKSGKQKLGSSYEIAV